MVDNTLGRKCDVEAPDKILGTDIPCIRALDGFVCLAVVINLCARCVIGRPTQSRQTPDDVPQALFMAVWRRKPKGKCCFIRIRATNSPAWTGRLCPTRPQNRAVHKPPWQLS